MPHKTMINKKAPFMLGCALLVAGLTGCDTGDQGVSEDGVAMEATTESVTARDDDAERQAMIDYGMETRKLLVCGQIDLAEYEARQNRGVNEEGFTSLEDYEYLEAFSEGVTVLNTRYEQYPEQKEQDCATVVDTEQPMTDDLSEMENPHGDMPEVGVNDIVEDNGNMDIEPEGANPTL